MSDLISLDAIGPDDLPLVGGKALSLGLMLRAGLPVPPGFCLTTEAYRRGQLDEAAVIAAYRALGAGPVAVRSSATAEDGEVSSFAGQQETYLGIEGEEALLQAIAACWASLQGDRAVAYRRSQGLEEGNLAMAVVVQRLIAAEVAGVLFTRDPLSAEPRMLVEASWGLGESVVGGHVVPDRFTLDPASGTVVASQRGQKTVERLGNQQRPVSAERRAMLCLTPQQLQELAALGRAIEQYFAAPRDVEWAWADGRFWLLQARPITATGVAEREQVRQEEIAALWAKASPRGTVWARFNLSEILPEPTPLTWALVSRFLMSSSGGFGQMYRDLGYRPAAALDHQGVYDLVCDRPYCNLSREPLLHHDRLPLVHPLAELKADPRRAMYPTPQLDVWSAPWSFWLYGWLDLWSLGSARGRQRALLPTFARRFRDEIIPAFVKDLHALPEPTSLADENLLPALQATIDRTLVAFARDSLKPTALAAVALADLQDQLASVMPRVVAENLARELTIGVRLDPEADLPGALRDLAHGRLDLAAFLNRFGHRGSQEMELSQPRWNEDASGLERLTPGAEPALPSIEQRLAACTHLTAEQRPLLLPAIQRVHEYLALRETAKHFLMLGMAQIRQILVEIDRRKKLHGGIFFLLPEELPRLLAGEAFGPLIAQRRRRRALALSLECPDVLFSDDLQAIGRPLPVPKGDVLEGVPLSGGVVEAVALVLERPEGFTLPPEGYILVCPSTDPAWVPLFVQARGLVMETGGVLSHGAIVAREFGLPAVAGIAGATHYLRTGERLRVDGTRGLVSRISNAAS
ncbi:MAG: PEP/pyruvate-binding domain-containing protein [Gemmataceae bacterium]